MDPTNRDKGDLDEIEDMLEKEARWILENAFEQSISDQKFEDPMHPREFIEDNTVEKWSKGDHDKAPVFCTPYPDKRLDDDAKVFIRSREFQGFY